MFNQVEFGRRIKELRTDKGITQEELASELNISHEHMNKIERGRNGCSIDLLLDLSAYFEVSTDYLLKGEDANQMVARKSLQRILEELTVIVHGAN